MKSSKYLAVLLTAAMLASSAAITASANNGPETETYVLMNIPYSEFYQADVRNDVGVDAFTSATKAKTRTGTLAGGSYHTDSSGDAVEGVTFPVKLVGEVDLSAFKRVTDSDSLEITVTNRGKTNTTTYTGKETLFENPDYSYYVLDSVPSFYKEAVQNPDGSLSFSETKGESEEINATVELTKDSRYGDYQMNITSDVLSNSGDNAVTVYGVVISTEEGNDYGLRHLENIWRNTALAWCTGYTQTVHGCETSSAHYEAMAGQTINKVTYYTSNGIKTISDLSLYVDPEKYALMNIPYSEFYASELENEAPVDVFTSATMAKTRNSGLAGGSYHAKNDGSEITGITYPVKLGDVDLSSYRRITDSDSYEATVTNRGKTTTTVYEGKDALFGSETYSYYILDEMPSYYKTVSYDDDGKLSFGKDNTAPQTIEAEAELTTETKYGDYQLNITSDALTSTDEHPVTVYGVMLSTEEGDSYGLRHLENIWRNTALAWCTGFTNQVHGCVTSSAHYEKMMGQTINKVTYFTSDGKKTFDTSIYVPVKTGASAAVQSAAVSDGQTTFTADSFAEDFAYTYTVTNDSDSVVDMTVADGTVTYPTDTPQGKYTLTISDANGKYASVVTDFELTVVAPAQFNGKIISEEPGLIAAEGASEDDFADFLQNIAQVTVGDKTFNASGKGAVKLIDSDTGLIDISNTDVFAEDANEFTITVKATGYDPLTFTLARTQAPVDDPEDDPKDKPSDNPTDEPTDKPSDQPTDKPTDKPASEQPDKSADNPSSEPADDPKKVPTKENPADGNSNTPATPSQTENGQGADVPKTADSAAAAGAVMALLAMSAGAIMLLERKRKNEK